jgi:hypothetical protein
MIVSREHKFIFLKTKKTAGTSVELALSQITPISPNDEPFRANGRAPQNWRVHGWWRSPRPLFYRRWLKVGPQDYGFYNHMPAKEARALLNDNKIWRSYFKFAFDRNPWDRQVSAYHYRYRNAQNLPPFSAYMRRRRRVWVNNYEIYSIDGDVCADFVGRFENLAADFRKGVEAGRALISVRSCRAPRPISGVAVDFTTSITTTRSAGS